MGNPMRIGERSISPIGEHFHRHIRLYATLAALLASVLFSMVLLALLGFNPFEAVGGLAQAFVQSKYLWGELFVYGCPLLLAGLGIGLALKANYWNIGAEGQLWWGALFAALAGIYITLPTALHIPLVLIAAFLGGCLWAVIPLFLKLRLGVNEILTNLLLNPVAVFFMNFLLWGPLKDPLREHPQTQPLQSTALFPQLFEGTRLHAGIFIGFLAVIVLYAVMRQSVFGFEVQAVGENPTAAAYNGINVKKVILKAGLIAGGLAGLAGGIMVMSTQSRLLVDLSPGGGFSGYGFVAIPVALLGQLNPIGIFFSSLLFGLLVAMGHVLQVQIGVSKFFMEILSGVIVLFVLYSNYIVWKWNQRHG